MPRNLVIHQDGEALIFQWKTESRNPSRAINGRNISTSDSEFKNSLRCSIEHASWMHMCCKLFCLLLIFPFQLEGNVSFLQ